MSAVRGSYFGCAGLLTERDARNMRTYTAWLLGTLVVWAAATLLIDGKFVSPAIGWTLTALSLIGSVLTVRSYTTFLRDADELLRKIQIEGLALGFGAGAVFMLTWRLCERLGAHKLDMDDPFIVMMLFWGLGQWLGVRRYAGGEEQ